ncbi:MAG: ankyrin repeat domain-containing protein, partial [Planctomycetota bacterium]
MRCSSVSCALALLALSQAPLPARPQDSPFALPAPRADDPVLGDEQRAQLAQRLCEAIDRGDPAAVAAAIDEGANPNVGMGAGEDDTAGRTPLIHAVIAGSVEAIDVLVARGARLDNGDDHEHTPLMYAALVKNVDLVRHLVRLGARLDMVDEKEQTALDYDDEAPEIAAVLDLAAKKNQELLHALSAGDVDAAKLALGAGASPNANDGTTSMMMFAVRRGDLALAKTCLDGGGRADLVHVAGWTVDTPLGVAAEARSPELMRLLLEKGAPGRAALDEALAAAAGCEHADRKDRVQALLNAGADPSLDSLLKTPALPAAASRGDLETMALLLAGGAQKAAVDHALIRAAGLDDATRAKGVVQALLACGADPSFAYLFTTALGAAVEKGPLEVAAILCE